MKLTLKKKINKGKAALQYVYLCHLRMLPIDVARYSDFCLFA